jgi:hypothetical protein
MQQRKEFWPQTFKLAFCQKFGYVPANYRAEVFWRSLYRHALPVAGILYRLKPEFFKEDFDLIAEIAEMTDPELFKGELNFFFGRNLRDKNWFRRILCIRVSADRLIALKNKVFHLPLLRRQSLDDLSIDLNQPRS